MSRRTTGLFIIAGVTLAAGSAYAQPTPTPTPAPAADSPIPPVDRPPVDSPPPAATPTEQPHTLEQAPPVSEAAPVVSFTRTPYAMTVGEKNAQWKLTLYGFIEFDAMHDSTQTYNDYMGNSGIKRDDTYAGQHGRLQFTPRNSRLGIKFSSPEYAGLKPSGVLEGDFFGVDNNSNVGANEQKLFNSPTYRIRHAYLKLENSIADVLVGQYYYLFGQQPYFFPASAEFLGLPNQVFGRTTQVRLSHTFKTDPVNIDFAVAAMRPPQRESEVPEGQAGLRISFNDWKGIHTPGNGGTTADPLAIGVSGTVRQFRVVDSNNLAKGQANPGSNADTGWGISLDALLPVIPVKNSDERGNALTLNGSYVFGSGIGDQYTGGLGGIGTTNFKTAPATATSLGNTNQPGGVDPSMVAYDPKGFLHTINWQTILVGIQYYVPPAGRIILTANASTAFSTNAKDIFGASTGVVRLARYVDGNVFFDVTPAVRLGLSYQYTTQTYADEQNATNHRAMALALYFF